MNNDINQVIISGRLTSDARTNDNKSFAAFDIAHNMGKDRETLYDSVKAFDKNGNDTVEIPLDILTKGHRVKVTGYRRTEVETYQGNTRKKTYVIATKIEDYPWDGNAPEEE